ncbi:putative TPR domain-containing protein [Colletotrichum sublineola]|uniref:Putative TPR domain-containing protein n=1 Tax=Colletotrichum sublineola TaxID=1173701 RepID=A0A066XM53_COLSU|nr:putative TPR domain-containing protein [Colletotrichum sublineola]
MFESGGLPLRGKTGDGKPAPEPRVFSSTGLEATYHHTPKTPYITFTLGPGRLERLVVKIWSSDQGDDLTNPNDPKDVSHTGFALGPLQKTEDVSEVDDQDLYIFQRNVRASNAMRCYTNEWNIGIPAEDDDSTSVVDGWLESLALAEGLEIGVFPLSESQGWVNLVWKMEIHLLCREEDGIEVGCQCADNQDQGDSQRKPRHLSTTRLIEREEAFELILHEASEDTPENDPSPDASLSNLSASMQHRIMYISALADSDQIILDTRAAIEATPNSQLDRRVGLLGTLVTQLGDRFKHTGAMENLEEAISISKQAIAMTPSEHPYLVSLLSNLGRLLGYKHLRTGAMSDLDEAIKIVRQAFNATPKDHPDWVIMLHNLGIQLHTRFTSAGAMSDLEEAIDLARQAVEATPDDDNGNLLARLNNLSIRLSDRFTRTGMMSDLEESIDIARRTVEAVPSHHFDRVAALNNLGNRLGERYERTGVISDLEEAVSLARQAVEASPAEHPIRASLLNNLAYRLQDLSLHNRVTADAEEAVKISEQAVQAIPNSYSDRAATLFTLGYQFVARQAVEDTPADHPELVKMMNVLGFLLYQRFLRTCSIEDLLESTGFFVESLHSEASAMYTRIAAGRQLLWMPNITQCGDCMYDIAQTTVGLIPLSAPLSLVSAEKKDSLSRAAGAACDAAAVALQAGKDPISAIQLLEVGRGIIASSLQNLRTDLSLLQERHAEMASSFDELRRQLDAPTSRDTLQGVESSSGLPPRAAADLRYKASRDMAVLLAQIREKPGFERFLLPATEAEILGAAKFGPIVMLNVSSHRCDALIIEPSRARVLELQGLSQEAIVERASNCGSIETLEWLWDVVVGPVLEALGFNDIPPADCWPRVWWIPTGPMSRFPLHAAGYHTQPGNKSALDRVISSYSSSIKAISHTRHQQKMDLGPESSGSAVLLSMTNTPGERPLQYAAEEISVVQSICVGMGLSTLQPQPNHAGTLSALANCKIFHFAGHGSTHSDPLLSQLCLEDWKHHPLTVSSLLETQLSSVAPFLAFLSACGTGQNRDEESADESIHLTSTFQLAGFRHVIGTLWEVDDKLCVDMAKLTYDFMCGKSMSDASVSGGLHHASRALRDRWVDNKVRIGGEEGKTRDILLCDDDDDDDDDSASSGLSWVPYIHYGV